MFRRLALPSQDNSASMIGSKPPMTRALIVLSLALAWRAGVIAQPRRPRALDAPGPIGTFIAGGDEREGYGPADRQLAQWALEAWQRAAGSALRLTSTPEASARVRLLITRRGEPIAEVTPPSPPRASSGWLGSLRSTGRIVGDIVSPATPAEDWEVLGS